MKKVRQSNFELLRIVSIFLIIIWHIILHGKIFTGLEEPYGFLSKTILSILIVHVNSLIFITGYFMGKQNRIKISKAVKLLGTGWFYSALIAVILTSTGLLTLSKLSIMEDVLPINLKSYWFLNCYVVIYLLSPYLNKITEDMTKKEFLRFLTFLIILLSVLPTITNDVFIQNRGYSIINFTIMYYLGSYFRRYPISESIVFQKLSNKKRFLILIALFFLIAIIRVGFYYLGNQMEHINSQILGYWGSVIKNSFVSYADPLVILQTCIYCLIFETINIKSKVINYMATSTLGIYLIHDNTNLRQVLYKGLNVTKYGASKKAFLVLFVSAIVIYVGCFIIENIRKGLVNLLILIKNRMFSKSAHLTSKG